MCSASTPWPDLPAPPCVFEPATGGTYEQHQQNALDYLRYFYAAEIVSAPALVRR